MKIIISVITSALSFPGPGLVGLHHLITHHIKQRHIPPWWPIELLTQHLSRDVVANPGGRFSKFLVGWHPTTANTAGLQKKKYNGKNENPSWFTNNVSFFGGFYLEVSGLSTMSLTHTWF